jgi:prepilin-type N-terminal cleavage/methylation domain-containing protein/prepilin-type processing-associated H-X9-DG protein
MPVLDPAVRKVFWRPAFTLIELLVVIACLGVLIGLLLPAVQQVRAVAAVTQCRSNLREIAAAALHYESINRYFPPGLNVSPNSMDPHPDYNFPPPWAGPYTGSLAYLLPYIEQGNTYQRLDQFDPDLFQLNSKSPAWAYGYRPWDFQDPNVLPSQVNDTGAGYPKAANTTIKTYLCPADPGTKGRVIVDACTMSTTASFGWLVVVDWLYNIPGYGAELGRSNYVGVGGASGKVPDGSPPANLAWAPYTGIYYENSQTKIRDITDGTSNTLAFGESLGGLHNDGSRDRELSWMGAGWLRTRWGLAPVYGAQNNDYTAAQYQSKHPNGMVNFAFADGSVRGLKQTIDFTVFIYLSGMHDGKTFLPSDLD